MTAQSDELWRKREHSLESEPRMVTRKKCRWEDHLLNEWLEISPATRAMTATVTAATFGAVVLTKCTERVCIQVQNYMNIFVDHMRHRV